MKKSGLYIHFPFCRRACFYCHFFKKKHRQISANEYLGYLAREMRRRRDPGLPLDTVYIGGGSPSLLTAAQLGTIMAAVANNYNLVKNAEITLEANPEDLAAPQLRACRRAGVNRLSIGVQSFRDRDLRCLKRTHSAAQALQAMEQARDAGFTNISLDLIIGLETQTSRSMELNFRQIEKSKPTHVSVYILEGVPRPTADEHDARLYFQARQSLLDLGYNHYEVSNFCRPHRASRHNLKYWKNQPYIGLGPSAAGYLNSRDYKNFSDLKKYYAALNKGILPEQKTAPLQPDLRRIITGLRLLDGIPASAFKSFPNPTDFLLTEGFLVRKGKNIAVPVDKILLLNEILGYFI
ncbi:MAG TPA: radical SAM family heme chaperone HemW [Patescibacteria group bacterium]|nr:radical SAM family heme chaperone HemW [Patescibacteria group bacterium]